MSTDLCPLCGTPQTCDGDWPACACDRSLHQTLTVRQAAAWMHLSRGGIYHLINDGYLAAVRSSRPLLVRLVTLKSYVAADHALWRQSRTRGQR